MAQAARTPALWMLTLACSHFALGIGAINLHLVPLLTDAVVAAAPFLMLVYSSFTADKDKLPFETTTFSFANYIHIINEAKTWQVIGTTAVFTIGATAIGIGIAMCLAWVIERTDIPFRRFLFVAAQIGRAHV